MRSSKLRAFTSAPCVTKRCATCTFPVRAAMCNGVSLPGGTGDHSFCMFSLIKPVFGIMQPCKRPTRLQFNTSLSKMGEPLWRIHENSTNDQPLSAIEKIYSTHVSHAVSTIRNPLLPGFSGIWIRSTLQQLSHQQGRPFRCSDMQLCTAKGIGTFLGLD